MQPIKSKLESPLEPTDEDFTFAPVRQPPRRDDVSVSRWEMGARGAAGMWRGPSKAVKSPSPPDVSVERVASVRQLRAAELVLHTPDAAALQSLDAPTLLAIYGHWHQLDARLTQRCAALASEAMAAGPGGATAARLAQVHQALCAAHTAMSLRYLDALLATRSPDDR